MTRSPRTSAGACSSWSTAGPRRKRPRARAARAHPFRQLVHPPERGRGPRSLGFTACGRRPVGRAPARHRRRRRLRRLVESTIDAARLRPVDPDWPGLRRRRRDAGRPLRRSDRRRIAGRPRAGREGIRRRRTRFRGRRLLRDQQPRVRVRQHRRPAGDRARHHRHLRRHPPTRPGRVRRAGDRCRRVGLGELDGAAAGARCGGDRARRRRPRRRRARSTTKSCSSPSAWPRSSCSSRFDSFNAKAHWRASRASAWARRSSTRASTSGTTSSTRRARHRLRRRGNAEATRRPRRAKACRSALAHDRRTARKAGIESTGHAIPGGETWGPFPQNLFMAGGDRRATI